MDNEKSKNLKTKKTSNINEEKLVNEIDEKKEEITDKNNKSEIVEEKEINEIGKVIKNERKKKLPEEESKKALKQSIWNISVAIIIALYFIFLSLGFKNIERNIFTTDLKVFSISVLVIAIFLFERAYKKENKKIVAYGIELLAIAFFTIALLYICIINPEIFLLSILVMSIISMVYYLIKSLVTYITIKKEYNKQNNELNVVQKEEVE